MINQYKGEYLIDIGGQSYKLVYDWNALAVVSVNYSPAKVASLYNTIDPKTLAGVLAAGLIKHHPEITAEKIIEISPAYMPCVEAVDKAMAYAYFGTDEIKSEKKNLLANLIQRIT
jgi:hypothetical protein